MATGLAALSVVETLESRQLLSASIGIQYAGNGTALNPTDVAGIVPQANYNVEAVGTGSGTGIALNDSTGAATTATLTFNGGGPYQVPNFATAATPDQVLNSGFVFGTTTTTISNIPYAQYDVYVYELNDHSGDPVTGDGRVQTTTVDNRSFYNTSPDPSDANHVSGMPNTYQYTQATSSDINKPTIGADYVLFDKVSDPTLTINNSASGNGFINAIQIVPDLGAPSMVTGLTANGNQLTWQPAGGATSYNVLRSTVSGQETVIKSGLTSTSFLDTSAVGGTKYYYTVEGVSQYGTGAPSAEVATTAPATPPPAPATLTAAGSPSGVSLNWAASQGALNYNVLRSTTSGQEMVIKSGVTGTSFTDTTAAQGTKYFYTVEGVNTAGAGAASPEASASPISGIGIQYAGNGTQLAPTDVAGLLPQDNYNVEAVGTGSGMGIALNDGTGAATAATLTFTGGGPYQVPMSGSAATPDQKLNSGFVFGTTTTTISNIPYPQYDVYVYELNDGAGRTETTTVDNRTFYGVSANPNDAGHVSGMPNVYQYTQSTSTDPNNGTPNGDYVLFDKVNDPTLMIMNSAPGNGYINGIQIVQDTSAPDAVPTLTGTVQLNGILLNWGAAQGATSYNVLRSTTSGQEMVIKSGVTGTTYTDTTAVPGTQYFYTVQGVNQYGAGPSSPEVSGKVLATPPPPPATLTALPGSSGVKLNWSASNGAVTYNVLRSTTSGQETVIQSGVTGTSFADTTAAVGTQYFYTVEAVNQAGAGAPSPEASALPRAGIGIQYVGGGTPLGATDVAGVVLQNNYNLEAIGSGTGMDIPLSDSTGGATSATLTFNGGGPFQVPNSATAATPDQKLNSGFVFGTTTTTVSQIPYPEYDVYVYELNDGPGRVQITTLGNQTFYNTSADPSDANHVSGMPNTYQYTQTTSTDVSNPTPAGDYVLFSKLTDPSFTLTNMANGNGYINGIEIVPVNSTPDAVTALSATGLPGAVQLTWTAAQGATFYNVLRSTTSGAETTLKSGLTGTSYADTSAVPGTTYFYTVQGLNNYGTGPSSPEASAMTSSTFPAPAMLTATPGPTSINLSWSGSPGATSYNVLRSTTSGQEMVLQSGVTGTSFSDTAAVFGTPYFYTVEAVYPGGTSGPSNEVTSQEVASIGIQFKGKGTALMPSQVAGVVPQANYNVEAVGTGSGSNLPLVDSTGAATPVTLTFTGGGPYQVPNFATAATPDQVLNSGFVFGTTSATVSNIPYANYDVYVYELNDGPNREETTTIGNQTFYGTSADPSDANHVSGMPNTYQYTRSVGTNAAAPTPYGDYVEFTGLTGSSFTLMVSAPGNGYLNGIQIVPVVPASQAAAHLVSTAFNDGSAAAGTANQTQRSEVRQIVLTFDKPVTLGPGAVSLSLLNTGGSGKNDGSAATDASATLGTPTSSDGGLTWIIPVLKSTTYSDATGSLKDGIYTVAVDPTKVSGAKLAGSNLSTTFHRLFGDINGDKTVNNTDYFKFNKAFGSKSGQAAYNADFDFNGDGIINNTDYFQFNKNFAKTFTY